MGGKCPTREWRSRFTIRGAGDQAQPYERATSTVCLTQIVGALVTIRSHVANRLWSEFKVKSGRRGWFCVILPFGETPTPPRPGPPHPHHITPLCDSVALASMERFRGWATLFAAQFCFGSLPVPHKPQTTPERLITSPTVSLPTSSALLISLCASSLSSLWSTGGPLEQRTTHAPFPRMSRLRFVANQVPRAHAHKTQDGTGGHPVDR